jgi:divalent metal cation (Fe/Co/Zn/Cd) transporter
VDSGIEVISAVGLLWRLRKAGPHAHARRGIRRREALSTSSRPPSVLLVGYITYEAIGSLLEGEEPLTSPVGIVLSVLSLIIMPALAFAKQNTGREMRSQALVADSKETWVCSYLSLALLVGVGLYALAGWWWADPIGALAMLPVIVRQGWETLAEARHHD